MAAIKIRILWGAQYIVDSLTAGSILSSILFSIEDKQLMLLILPSGVSTMLAIIN
ncbi:MAG: hypothetical protein LBS83_00525 [Holosporales bacterium]|nr:hypothetical protein [Holosporales bacterium]